MNAIRNYKITVEYDGGPFVGWQRQAKGLSVQGLLEKALGRVCAHELKLHGSGRTDAGVHARGQVASFTSASGRAPAELLAGANCLLPPEIAILAVEEVPPDFHARFSAVSKAYVYEFSTAPTRSALWAGRRWQVGPNVDWDRVRRALPHFMGRHDFAAFQSAGAEVKSTVRTILDIALTRPEENFVRLQIEGDGFLKQMVRAIAGTLVEIGRGRHSPESAAALIASARRSQAGRTAPPHGLYLERVNYL